jgi:hypothetical protein
LEEAIFTRLRSILPESICLEGGLLGTLLESWDVEGEWEEALEFVTRNFLDDLQDQIILQMQEGWPTPSGPLPMPEVLILQVENVLRVHFVLGDTVILALTDIPWQEFA